jgi:hypothetical protein
MVIRGESSCSELYNLRSLAKEASKHVKRNRIVDLESLEVAASGY